MEDTSAVSTSRPATPALVHSPSTARSSFSSRDMQTTHRPTPTRQPSGANDMPPSTPQGPPKRVRGTGLVAAHPDPDADWPAPAGPAPYPHAPELSLGPPYAYPFLPSCEPRGDARPSVSVDIFPDKYLLSCRMPHFDHSSITVATRRGRLLVITADRWDTIEPAPLSLDPALIPNPPNQHTLSAGLPLDGTLRWAGFALALTALRCTSQSPGAYSPPTRPPPPATALEWQTDTMPIPSPAPPVRKTRSRLATRMTHFNPLCPLIPTTLPIQVLDRPSFSLFSLFA
ncbi:hypothetical protein RHS01_09025 [Rhizoctonia solani]|uniref:Uncharacterized protein n=1 Tax=Rhizoctonia solani TaxID=456999 RepID=A0A8H7I4S3_9AGAM|nr:hypothetical protein RHS01_09025 [Rhizoctonia solani]